MYCSAVIVPFHYLMPSLSIEHSTSLVFESDLQDWSTFQRVSRLYVGIASRVGSYSTIYDVRMAQTRKIYATLKQKLYNFTTNALKPCLSAQASSLECFCDQQDPYSYPKASRKTAKRDSCGSKSAIFSLLC